MELQELPNEITYRICEFLGKPELLVISLSCKHLHLVAEPTLYAEFTQTEGAATPLLLRTLLQKPHLGLLFKSVLIHMYDDGTNDRDIDVRYNDEYLNEERRNDIKKHLQQYFCGYEQEPSSLLTSAQWYENIDEICFNQHYLNALLLLLLPRLESIVFSGPYQQNTYLLDIFLRASRIQLGDNPTGQYSLSHLQELSFMVQFDFPLSTSIDYVWPLMKLQSLRMFHFDGVGTTKALFSSPDIRLKTQHTPHIRHLTLQNCDIPMSEFDAILPQFEELQYFHITRAEQSRHVFRLTELVGLLVNSSETLSDITIKDFRRDWSDMREFPSFQHFSKLRSLTIACDLLDHVRPNPRPDRPGIIPRYIRFNETLPPSLEILKICSADRLSPAMQLNCNLNRLLAVPLLKTIVVEFTATEAALVDGPGGWKPLTMAFAQNGVTLELWTSEGRNIGMAEHFEQHRLVGNEWEYKFDW